MLGAFLQSLDISIHQRGAATHAAQLRCQRVTRSPGGGQPHGGNREVLPMTGSLAAQIGRRRLLKIIASVSSFSEKACRQRLS
jgi:hypothetical protein